MTTTHQKPSTAMTRKARFPIGKRFALLFAVYLLWLSYRITTTPGLKARVLGGLKRRLSLLQKGSSFYVDAKSGTTKSKISDYRRIPCGLIVIDPSFANIAEDSKEEDVLPLTTAAILPSQSGHVTTELSTLNARALKRYPQLRQLVQESGDADLGVIPAGAFRLRMGSLEGTIAKSPELRIVNDGGNDIDFVLGSIFWEAHSAEFGDDELYVSPTTVGDSTTFKYETIDRVMVPYLSIRGRQSYLEL
mmetsp:Transcript_34010/g.80068  ORF Transcript_34010/g.80068 Transcript_34010/m.80068 type:complete len:248 (+) Transcript_34010:112-855(+)